MRKILLTNLISVLALGFIFAIPIHTVLAQGVVAQAAGAAADAATSVVAKTILGSFDFMGVILSPLVIALVKVVSFITMISGVVLNASIYYTVILMSENIGKLTAINETWTVIRDVANMGFIFALLYASIRTIVGKDKDTQSLIVNMVIAAVLVNFSLFFTKVFIDVTNLLALTFYKAIAPGALAGTPSFLNSGLSNSIIDALGTQKLWQMYGNIDSSVVLVSSVMTIIVLIVTTFIFSAMAVMFIVRYVALIFVLVLSPLMFLSLVFPQLGDYAKKWRSTLVSQAVFAPVFMLMIWVTVVLIRGINSTVFVNVEPLGNALSGTNFTVGAVPTLVNYVMIIIFLIASFSISKGVSDGADGSVKTLSKWAMGFAGGATAGTFGLAGRKTIGWAGDKLSTNANLVSATKRDGLAGAGARLALYASKKASGGTFDLRNATIPTAAAGDLVRGTIGRTRIGRAIGADDLRTSSIEVGKPLANLTSVPSAGEKGYSQLEKEKKQRLSTESKAKEKELEIAENKIKIELGSQIASTKLNENARSNEEVAAVADMVKAIKKTSEEAIVEQKAEVLAIQEVAEALSQKQLEAIEKSPNFTKEEVDRIKSAKGARLNSAFTAGTNPMPNARRNSRGNIPTGDEKVVEIIKGMSYADIAKLDTSKLSNPAIFGFYNPKTLGKLGKELSEDKTQAIRDAVSSQVTSGIAPPGSPVDNLNNWLNGQGKDIF